MPGSFSISVDRSNSALLIAMSGFFDQDEVAAFVTVLNLKLDQLRCGANEHLTLCDVSAMSIQTQDIVAAFSRVVGNGPLRSKKLAFVTGSSLARMQTQRLTGREGVRFFTDVDTAKEWLFSSTEEPSMRQSPHAA